MVGADVCRWPIGWRPVERVDGSVRAMPPRLVATAACLALAVAACSSASGSKAAPGSSGPAAKVASPPTTTAAPTTTTRGRRGSGQPVTLAFGGDVHFEGANGARLRANPASVITAIAPTLRAADLAMVNLESAVAVGGTPENKQFVFRAPPTALDALRDAGIDVATEANNHGRDYGAEGLQESLAARDAKQFPVVGIGHNATEAYAPYLATVNGQRLAVFGATQVLDNELAAAWTATDTQGGLASAKDTPRLVAAIQAARPDVDTIVVFLHWGTENVGCPTADQQSLARALADAGADVIVGSHAHRLLGAGRLGSAFVDYGLGNFAFYTSGGIGTITGVLDVTVTGRDVDAYSWVPAVISNGQPIPTSGAAATQAITAWNGLRGCTGLTP
ncbi:MAG: Bacterial capsule synthesis protein [Actinomycetia bacterium]|nr:Bacterial capsule synthesis protein [Actinomycetes bacterium]